MRSSVDDGWSPEAGPEALGRHSLESEDSRVTSPARSQDAVHVAVGWVPRVPTVSA